MPDTEAIRLKLNGNDTEFTISGNEIYFRLPEAENIKLEFIYRSKYFRFTENDLENISSNSFEPQIGLEEDTETDRFSAVRIRNFFKMYRNENGKKNPPDFKLINGKEEITLAKDTFTISAPTAEKRYELTTMLLSVLDKAYPHFGRIGIWPAGYPRCAETGKMREKAGLTKGTILQWDDPAHFMNRNFKLRGQK